MTTEITIQWFSLVVGIVAGVGAMLVIAVSMAAAKNRRS